ncbi:hypothetical protein [Candidatus Pelagibacter ubique]|uniref:hypothetical protein n=1 Tax=Pelagibacter ubique TaxID=198252 RepID=UPI0003D1A55D
MISNYFLLYFSALIISFSILGYGYLLSRIIDKDLSSYNLGYQGLLGILFLTFISYLTIFFVKHGYIHNIIVHIIGISSFLIYFKKKIFFTDIKKYIILFSILFIGLLIIRNHDDFNYYHLTYSLGLTEHKIFIGLGQFGHGYKHHSSLFLFNSITFLPYIKYYLFHSLGWFTLVFVNYLIIDYLLFKNKKELNFEYFFYLFLILFINIKFSRIGGYGTDLSSQMILMTIFPLIYSTLQIDIKSKLFKSNLFVIILLITYTVTLKSFFIFSFLFLISFLLLYDFKKIFNIVIFNKTFIFSITLILLLITVNLAYTGCAIYPVKSTCLSNELSWALEKDHVGRMHNWYQQWAKSGASSTYRVENPEEYIKGFNWVSNWFERYFLYKFKELIIGLMFTIVIFLVLFRGSQKKISDKKKWKSLLILFIITLILFFEWFYNHPALRYGGYHLVCIIFFIPVCYYLSQKKLLFINKKKIIISLICISFLIFYIRNIERINEEHRIVKENNFPLFFSPQQNFKKIELEHKTNLYVPTDLSGCWAISTPCVYGVKNFIVDKKWGYKIFKKKKTIRND